MTQANEIDYDQLKLITSPISNNEEESHEIFMSTYSSIFVPTSHPEAGIPNQPTKSFLQAHPFFRQKPKSRSGLSRATSQSQFDIFTKQNEDDADTRASTASSTSKEALHREQLVSELYQIMLKFPFERNRKEHKRVLEIFVDLAPAELLSSIDAGDQKVVLQNLVHAATRIYYPDAGMTVFGNSGLFMILKGSVRPQAIPYLNLRNWSDNADDNASRTQTPILKRKHIKLNAGDCFGTFEQIQGKAHNSK